MAKTLPTKDDLLRLIEERRAEPNIDALHPLEREDFILNPNNDLRREMLTRDRQIREGLKQHGLSDPDFDIS